MITIIKQVVKGRLSTLEAAQLLQPTRRQVFRMLKRYRDSGDAGLVHRVGGTYSI